MLLENYYITITLVLTPCMTLIVFKQFVNIYSFFLRKLNLVHKLRDKVTDKWFTESNGALSHLNSIFPSREVFFRAVICSSMNYIKKFVLIDFSSNGGEEDLITYLHVVS